MNEIATLSSKTEVSLVEIHSINGEKLNPRHKELMKLKEGLEMAQEINQELKKAMESIIPES